MLEPSELTALIISGAVCIVGLAGFVFYRRDVAENKNKEENKDSKEAGRQESLIMNKLGVVEKGIYGGQSDAVLMGEIKQIQQALVNSGYQIPAMADQTLGPVDRCVNQI